MGIYCIRTAALGTCVVWQRITGMQRNVTQIRDHRLVKVCGVTEIRVSSLLRRSREK
jgi:hypothetical protein